VKEKKEDRVLNEARSRAIKKAHIPQTIRDSYKISVKSGKVILSKKNK
jgi:hypothetical protein